MGFWYNKKDDEKAANLSCTNWEEVNSKIEFTELGFTSDDTFYLIVANATKFSDCIKMGEKDFTLTEQLVKFKVAKKDYVKKDWKTKADTNIVQSRVEKWICKIFDNLNAELRYQGFLHLQDGNFIENFLTGKDQDGKEIPAETLKWMATSYEKLEEVEEKLITSDLLNMPTYKSSGGFSRGQSEKEKIEDRLKILETLVKDTWGINEEDAKFTYLVKSLLEGDDKAIYFLQVFEKLVG